MKYLPLLAILISCCVIQADIVYLSDGSEVEGITSQNDGQVSVELRDGQKKTFSESEILYVAKGPLRDNPTPTQTAGTPQTQPSQQTTSDPTSQPATTKPVDEKPNDDLGPVKIDSDSDESQAKLQKCARDPADMLYEYLRRKISSPTPGIEDLINTARIRIHDRMYRIGSDWVKPEDFERHRQAFEKCLSEAQAIYKDAAKLSDKDEKESKQKQAMLENAQAKLLQAAKSWLDPLTRWFLLGIAAYNSQDYEKAIGNFSRCASQAPWVAAFFQGLGDAMMAVNRHEDAMSPYIRMSELTDDRSVAANILRDALQKTPGTKIMSEKVVNAKKFLEQLQQSMKSSRGGNSQRQAWLLPGKAVSCKPDSLPQLPFDMLTFKQGVAVPVTQQALLVGTDIVKDADTVIIVLRSWLYVTAKVEIPRNEPIAILWIPSNIQLTPVKISPKNSLKRGQLITAVTADISPAMSTQAREASANVKDIDTLGNVSLYGGLLPGEGTSPALDSSGELAGFIAGKLDTDKDSFPDRLITLSSQSMVGRRLMRYSKYSKSRPNQPAGMNINGQSFMVFAVGTLKLEKK
ncbi:MAG TPA: tetratricopeptide repeat protein [Phycisphaerae bacterium]|nr:tetratricopeptide repeat protein [Phycisphaerae bacterium]HPS53701.1 tetratricopeptide repeat protein [Phycisphaerae bacterium]